MFGQSINGSLELSLEILPVLQHLENLPVILLDHHAGYSVNLMSLTPDFLINSAFIFISLP